MKRKRKSGFHFTKPISLFSKINIFEKLHREIQRKHENFQLFSFFHFLKFSNYILAKQNEKIGTKKDSLNQTMHNAIN